LSLEALFISNIHPPFSLTGSTGKEKENIRSDPPFQYHVCLDVILAEQGEKGLSTTELLFSISGHSGSLNSYWTNGREQFRLSSWMPISRLFRRSKITVELNRFAEG
jgi:hypothetical protein